MAIANHLIEHTQAVNDIRVAEIRSVSDYFINTVKNDGTIYVCGNGGSAMDACHFVAELVARFEKERHPLKAICLNTNIATLTAISNDYDFQDVFMRQVQAFVSEKDLVIGLTTSGNSENVVRALKFAKALNAKTVSFTGNHENMLVDEVSDYVFKVRSKRTAIIQECHIMVLHIIAKLIEEECT